MAAVAISITGNMIRRPGTPAARMAVISPSPDIRLSVISTPTSTPIGIVKVSVNGNTSANRYPTVELVALARTSNSNSLPTRCRNSTKLNSRHPSRALAATSRSILRERVFMINARAPARWAV